MNAKLNCITTLSIVGALFGAISSSAYAQNAQVLAALNRFSNNNTQRETARAIAILCPAGGRLSDRLQQDCNSLVGAAFQANQSVGTALQQIAADQTPLAANRAQLASASELLGARRAELFGKMGSGLMTQNLSGASVSGLGWNYAMSDAGFGPWSFFGSLESNRVKRDISANQDGFDTTAVGVTLGLDRRIGETSVVGGALRYRKSDADYSGTSGTVDQRDITGDLYVSVNGESPWYFSAIGSIGKRSSDQERNVRYGLDTTASVGQSFFADFDTNLLSGALTLGYQANRESVNFDPYVQLEYARQKVDSYSERASNPTGNGAGWAVSVSELTGSTTSASVGLNTSWAISGSNGVYQPFVGLRWSQVIDSQEDNVGLRFVGDISSVREGFSAITDKEDRNFGTFMLGISAQFAEGRGGFIRVSRHFSESRYENTTLQLGFRAEF